MTEKQIRKETEGTQDSQEASLIVGRERQLELIKRFNLLSDTFLSVVLQDAAACQHVLRILMSDPGLNVQEVRTQYVVSKLVSHDAQLDAVAECIHRKDSDDKEKRASERRDQNAKFHHAALDILAEQGEGQKQRQEQKQKQRQEQERRHIFGIEIHREAKPDPPRRMRYYSALLDGEMLRKGVDYGDLPDLTMIYISQTNIWKRKRAGCLIRKYFTDDRVPGRFTSSGRIDAYGEEAEVGNDNLEDCRSLHTCDESYEDGLNLLYVNTAVDDGTEIARLMKYFKTADPDDMSQGALSERVRFLKKDEKGRKIMCEVTDEFIKIGEEIGEQRGIEIGEQRGEQRGIEIGEKSGAKKEKRNIARQLASMGMPLLQIATAVNASKKQVGRWVSEV